MTGAAAAFVIVAVIYMTAGYWAARQGEKIAMKTVVTVQSSMRSIHHSERDAAAHAALVRLAEEFHSTESLQQRRVVAHDPRTKAEDSSVVEVWIKDWADEHYL